MAKKKENYEKVRLHLCELHTDADGKKRCFTSANGKCPLAKFFCFEHGSLADVRHKAPPEVKAEFKMVLKALAKEYGIEV